MKRMTILIISLFAAGAVLAADAPKKAPAAKAEKTAAAAFCTG